MRATVERALTGSKIVILDAPNLVKGFRYELYTRTREARTAHCVVHLPISHQTALERNERLGRYPKSAFDDLWGRLETPIATNRWDAPLYTLPEADAVDGTELAPGAPAAGAGPAAEGRCVLPVAIAAAVAAATAAAAGSDAAAAAVGAEAAEKAAADAAAAATAAAAAAADDAVVNVTESTETTDTSNNNNAVTAAAAAASAAVAVTETTPVSLVSSAVAAVAAAAAAEVASTAAATVSCTYGPALRAFAARVAAAVASADLVKGLQSTARVTLERPTFVLELDRVTQHVVR